MAPVAPGALLFLYNHDAAHQIAHTVGILRELAASDNPFPLACAVAGPATERTVRAVLGEGASRVTFHNLSLPPWLAMPTRMLDRVVPATSMARLRHHADSLHRAALIVSPERTCLALKRSGQAGGPKFAFVPHGAGDRAVSYHPAIAGFDHILVSGPKVVEQMIAHRLGTAHTVHDIGYPKFDLIDAQSRPDFFDNGQFTFLYNPHFDPYLSSWYRDGPRIIEWFASGPGRRFNLILAPHVMLFRKRLHVSPEHRVARLRPGLKAHWFEAPNILIDVASERLFDMSYTLGSDAYIGDVSSQVYEFLIRPRAAYFIDVHAETGGGEYRYPFWEAGVKVGGARTLFPLLGDHAENSARHRPAQEGLFRRTFSRTSTTASARGAACLRSLMTQHA